jgi:hypothetical protein
VSITNDTIRDYLRDSPEAARLMRTDPQFRFSAETTRDVLADVERLMLALGIPADTARTIIHGVVYGTPPATPPEI